MQREYRLCTQYLFCRVVLFTILLCAGVSAQTASDKNAAGNHFYFVQITDTHFGQEDHAKRARQVIQAVNKLPLEIQFVVHTGDITMDKLEDVPTRADALAAFKLLKQPVHYIPGNHDILRQKHAVTTQAYRDHFGELVTQKEYEGVVCLFIYTEPLAKDFSVSAYDALDELEKKLESSAGKPVLVFHHTPSVEDFYLNRMHPGWEKGVREQWIALLNRYDVKGVIAGHFHRDEHHWLGNVPLYICPPVAGYWGRQATFRIYEYKDGKIGYRTQYIP